MRTALYRAPDVLIVHLKRFQVVSRWKEKLNTRVNFPLTGLDMSEFLSSVTTAGGGGGGGNSGGGEGKGTAADDSANDSCVYDLFAVSNHIGTMTAGHYTAIARCVNEADAGLGAFAEGAASSSRATGFSVSSLLERELKWSQSGKWILFDDEYTEEIPQDRVVSERAYVLFYRRRKMSAASIINILR